MRLEPGMTIADVGAGLGAWTLRFVEWTGPSGHVYTTDIGEEQLTVLRAIGTREGLSFTTSPNLPR
jgi:ubiquinone/menaquinone biosynthesis C-methylase UbiE